MISSSYPHLYFSSIQIPLQKLIFCCFFIKKCLLMPFLIHKNTRDRSVHPSLCPESYIFPSVTRLRTSVGVFAFSFEDVSRLKNQKKNQKIRKMSEKREIHNNKNSQSTTNSHLCIDAFLLLNSVLWNPRQPLRSPLSCAWVSLSLFLCLVFFVFSLPVFVSLFLCFKIPCLHLMQVSGLVHVDATVCMG